MDNETNRRAWLPRTAPNTYSTGAAAAERFNYYYFLSGGPVNTDVRPEPIVKYNRWCLAYAENRLVGIPECDYIDRGPIRGTQM
jgi:hypothetical protein